MGEIETEVIFYAVGYIKACHEYKECPSVNNMDLRDTLFGKLEKTVEEYSGKPKTKLYGSFINDKTT